MPSRLFLAICLLGAPCWPAAVRKGPDPGCRACVLQSLDGQVLMAYRARARIQPASLTKLMTAYLVFGAVREGRLDWDQPVRVSARAARETGSRIGLRAGEVLPLSRLAEALLVASGNDAAVALAEAHSGSVEAFVAAMNERARELGLRGTRYANPDGLTREGHYSTAEDLATLARRVWEDFPERRALYAERSCAHGAIVVANRNDLLRLDDRVDGLKTGYTAAAGFNLAFTAVSGGRRILGVTVGSPSRQARARLGLDLLRRAFAPGGGLRIRARR